MCMACEPESRMMRGGEKTCVPSGKGVPDMNGKLEVLGEVLQRAWGGGVSRLKFQVVCVS